MGGNFVLRQTGLSWSDFEQVKRSSNVCYIKISHLGLKNLIVLNEKTSSEASFSPSLEIKAY